MKAVRGGGKKWNNGEGFVKEFKEVGFKPRVKERERESWMSRAEKQKEEEVIGEEIGE